MDENGADLVSPSFTTSVVDTLRVLSQAQTDISILDAIMLIESYNGPPDDIYFFLSQYTDLGGTPDEHHKHISAIAFELAVKSFGDERTQPENLTRWESLIRKSIRQGVDVHGHKCLDRNAVWQDPDVPRGWGTLLDDLFEYTHTPLDALIVGNSWLRILASEGFVISTYLEEEITLHTAQNCDVGDKTRLSQVCFPARRNPKR